MTAAAIDVQTPVVRRTNGDRKIATILETALTLANKAHNHIVPTVDMAKRAQLPIVTVENEGKNKLTQAQARQIRNRLIKQSALRYRRVAKVLQKALQEIE